MDSLVTILTLKLLNQLKILHLEPTNVCQAECPQCAREVDSAFNKKIHHHLTIDKILASINADTIKHLDKMFMCGNYGDPAAGKHTLEIYEYFRKINPTITLGMNTNGGINDVKWWERLSKILTHPADYAVFSIDGLADTNHVYRQKVVWDKIMSHAQAFINNGGRAHWDMLVFEHNKHQVDACQSLAKDMGFVYFRAKVSRRHQEFPVTFLQHPRGWKTPDVITKEINCQALTENSLYMNSEGTVYPCCWQGTPYGVNIMGFSELQKSWSTNPNQVCQRICGVDTLSKNSFKNQWQREISFV